MGKILYIRLDSSPLPEACDEIIVKDFNLESYFCTLLGKRLLGGCSITQSVPFWGKIVSDFKDSSPEIYSAIIAQWENILIQLLVTNDIQGQRFEINIPFAYFDWLFHHENPIYKEIGKIQSLSVDFEGRLLYKELVDCILMKRLRFTLSKITDEIDYIVVSLPIQKKNIPFISYVMQLNNKFNGLDIIDRQMFIDTYIASKRIAEKKATLEMIYEQSLPREGRIRIRDKKTKKYGFVNEQMELVVPCEYDFCGNFVEGLAFAYDKIKGINQIDKSGNIQDLPSYDYYEVYDFSDGLARVRKDKEGNYAYINREGKEIINVFYPKGCRDFKEGLAVVLNANHKYGFIDKAGVETIPCQFDYASDFSDGLARVEINDKSGFVNKTGKMVIPCKYEGASDFSEGLASVYINNESGFIDKSGRMVIPCRCYWAQDFSEGLVAICRSENDSRIYFIDKSGKTIISTSALSYKFSDGLAAIFDGDKVGYINKTGKIVIPKKFHKSSGYTPYACNHFDFSDGLAIVQKDILGLYGIIDKNGTKITPFKYEEILPFSEGIACVRGRHFNYGYINPKGKELVPTVMNKLHSFSEGMAWISVIVKGECQYTLIKKEWIM